MISSKLKVKSSKPCLSVGRFKAGFASSLSKGFTMIELLIVIAVLGILATAVLSAINPIEQINRGRDTGSRSDAEQLLSAIDRFYTSAGYYPWMLSADSTNTAVPFTEIKYADQKFGDDGQQVLTNLSSGGTAELKASFVNKIVGTKYRKLWLYNSGVAGESTYVCFIPQSSSFRDEAWKRCKATLPTDFPTDACPNDGTCQQAATADKATGCYICLP